MTSGSRLEIVSSSRLVGVFHGVRASSGVFVAMRWMMIEKVLGVTALWDQVCFGAKSLWQLVWTGYLVPYSDLGPTVIHMRGQGALPGPILSHHVRVVGGTLLGDTQPPVLDACGGTDCLSTCIIDFYIEHVAFYHGLFTLCGECYSVCMSVTDRVITTDSDGTGPCTRVYDVGCVWASVVVPYHHQVMSAPVPEAAVLAILIRRVKAPEWDGWMPGSVSGRGKRGTGRLVLGLVF
jgi:hypothetical protein